MKRTQSFPDELALDHFYQKVQHLFERLILSHHFEHFTPVMFQPFVPLSFPYVPRDSLEPRRYAVLALQPQADLDGSPPSAARYQLKFEGSRSSAS